MEPVGVRVCRETKQVSYKIPRWFNFSVVVGNSLICISEGTAEPEGGRGGWDWKPGLGASIPAVCAVSQLLLQSRGLQGSGSAQHTLPLTIPGLWCIKTPVAQGWALDLGLCLPVGIAAPPVTQFSL